MTNEPRRTSAGRLTVKAISNLVLTQQIYSEETNGAHAQCREPVPLRVEQIEETVIHRGEDRGG